MSDQPRDEDELQSLLSGESALSRRYRELSDEQPPEIIDAAILASARWAVGADSHGTGSDKTGSDKTDSHQTASENIGSKETASEEIASKETASKETGTKWRRRSFMSWGVPLATAAVVVVAVALTITIERDPEIDRLYDKYDSAESDLRKNRSKAVVGKTEVASSEMQAQPRVSATSSAPESPATPAPLRAPASAPAAVAPQKEQLKEQQPTEQGRTAARKRNEQPQQQAAAKQSVERDQPGIVAADIETNVLAEQKAVGDEQGVVDEQAVVKERVPDADKPAEAFPASGDAFADNKPAVVDELAEAGAADSPEESAIAGASASADSLSEAEPAELMQSAEEISPGRLQPSTRMADDEAALGRERADQDAPTPFAETEATRSPEEWIEDIEQLLADGKREEAITALEDFRLDYPDYLLPESLQSLLPAQSE